MNILGHTYVALATGRAGWRTAMARRTRSAIERDSSPTALSFSERDVEASNTSAPVKKRRAWRGHIACATRTVGLTLVADGSTDNYSLLDIAIGVDGNPVLAYAQSKTANVLFAVAATARWADDGITANALMPGAIPTNLQRHTGGMRTPMELRKTPEQGAATTVLLAASPLLEGVGGRYFADCNEALDGA